MKYTYWPITKTFEQAEQYPDTLDSLNKYLKKTSLLNFTHPGLVELIARRGWLGLDEQQRIEEMFDFVKNEIVFGYNKSVNIPASRVFLDGYGCNNSKSILLMALLRKCQIPCRIHVVRIDKILHQKPVLGLAYYLVPRNIVHSWVEIWFEYKWVKLVGYMLDSVYQQSMQKKFANPHVTDTREYCASLKSQLNQFSINKQTSSSYTPKEYLDYDFGVFDSPDDFYKRHASDLECVRPWLFKHLAKKQINTRLAQVRRDGCRMQDRFTSSRLE